MPTAAKRPRWVWAKLDRSRTRRRRRADGDDLDDAGADGPVQHTFQVCAQPPVVQMGVGIDQRDAGLRRRVHARGRALRRGDLAACAESAACSSARSGTVPVSGRAGLIADQLQAIARHLETLATQVLMQAWVELGDQIGVEAGRQVVNGSGSQATEVIVQVAAGVVPRPVSHRPAVSLVATPMATKASSAL